MLEGFTWLKQSGYRWDAGDATVYIDPWDVPEDSPPADVILITHAHFDHLSLDDVERLGGERTVLVAPRDVADELRGDVRPVWPGDAVDVRGVAVQAVPAYNVVEGREENHPRRNGWVGYVLELNGRRYYHAGDTDHLPELEEVTAGLAFLPIGGGGFTMDGREAASLARAIAPEVAVPMHYGFVEGCHDRQEVSTFEAECGPVRVRELEPAVPFEF